MKAKYLLTALLPVLCACSDSDKWEPGPAENPDSPQLYFTEPESYNPTFEGDDDRVFDITVKRRVVTDEPVTVNLLYECNAPGALLPPSVTFEPGQSEALLQLDFNECPNKTTYDLTVSLPAEDASIYAAGTSRLDFKITVAGSWIPVSKLVTFKYSVRYTPTTTELMWLEGSDKYRFNDFIGSGMPLMFNLGGTSGNREIIPISNAAFYSDLYDEYDEYKSWYFYDSANDNWPYVYPNGEAKGGIEYALFYGTASYSYISFKNNKGYMTAWATFTDGTENWLDVNIDLGTLEFNPQ